MPDQPETPSTTKTPSRAKAQGRNSPLFVNSLEKGFLVLKAFSQQHKPLSLNEICQLTGLDKSAVQRFTHSLVTLGYLAKDKRTRHYYPAPPLLDLCYTYLRSDTLVDVAAPYVLYAHEDAKEAVNLGRRAGDDIMYIIRIPSPSGRLIPPLIGGRAPLFCTASGRAMLSAMADDEIAEVLDKVPRMAITSRTITDRELILSKVLDTRRDGFTIAEEECLLGELTIAAPILDSHKQVIAAINISVTTRHWSVDRLREELAPVVLRAAQSISRALGYPGGY